MGCAISQWSIPSSVVEWVAPDHPNKLAKRFLAKRTYKTKFRITIIFARNERWIRDLSTWDFLSLVYRQIPYKWMSSESRSTLVPILQGQINRIREANRVAISLTKQRKLQPQVFSLHSRSSRGLDLGRFSVFGDSKVATPRWWKPRFSTTRFSTRLINQK